MEKEFVYYTYYERSFNERAIDSTVPIAWPREKAIRQCKELMDKLVEIINIYNFTEEDFKP
jgi:hypothetical protein